MKPVVLVADDDDGVRFTLRGLLEDEGLAVEEARDGEEALERVRAGGVALVLCDLRMPRRDGMGVLRALREEGRGPERGGPRVVMLTAHGSERHAVEALKLGAWDYFRKPFEMEEVLAATRRALEPARLAQEKEQLEGALLLSRSLLFASASMRALAVLVARVAPRDVTVLLTGETGTGKERVAEALVRASKRAARPYVRFSCADLSPELLEAELFGHSRGAFTGAVRARTGLLREADGGTVLLDEVAELSPSAQARLLRVLQEGEVRPVGEDRPVRVDVRVLAATHADLAARVREGRFREDLWFRLKVVHLQVPPLRERPEDIQLLGREFLRRAQERFGVPLVAPREDFERALAAWRWPGNVRELEHAIESMVALSPDGALDLSLLPRPEASARALPAEDEGAPLRVRVEGYERGLLVSALAAAKGNRSEAARALGIGRATLHEKMRKYELG